MALPSQQRVPSRSTLLRPTMEATSKSPSKPRWLMLGIVAVVFVLVVVFAAAKRYQAAHGRWPTSLNELTSQDIKPLVKTASAQAVQTDRVAASPESHAARGGAMILRNVKAGHVNAGGRAFDGQGNGYVKDKDIAFILQPVRQASSISAATPATDSIFEGNRDTSSKAERGE